MRYVYPVNLLPQEGGGYLVTFPDVPEALTQGNDREDALREGRDALRAAFGGYVQAGWDIPPPSTPKLGQALVYIPLLLAAKLALYITMRKDQVSYVALADKLDISERAMRRLVHPDYGTHIKKVEAALDALNKHIAVTDFDVTSRYYFSWSSSAGESEPVLIVRESSRITMVSKTNLTLSPFYDRGDDRVVQINNPENVRSHPVTYSSGSRARH